MTEATRGPVYGSQLLTKRGISIHDDGLNFDRFSAQRIIDVSI
jgi:hypothetical protein